MYYGSSGSQITKDKMLKALNKLGDLLRQNNQKLDLVCCGGIVSVLYHGSRHVTHDVDVLFPNNPRITELLKTLVDQVGAEFGLEHGPRDKWFNDSVSFIGLQSRSNTVVFRHSHLVLKAADWHEMLAHKLTAFRGDRDINDAVHFLKEITPNDHSAILKKVTEYRPFVPHVADELFEKRFNQVWEKTHGKP
ncbi:hypothetical protein [Litoribacillus peritrichatus]|uniref:Uncharacterized protein n=1 Tax=Litoribacillus peritrichatus TaxID=718191 RepID=A0ABP7MJ27_9GAMM